MRTNKQARRTAKGLFSLCLVNDRLDEDRTREVAKRVAATGRRDCQAILAHFLRLVKLDRARHSANIQSATPLPSDLRIDILATLARRYGPALISTFSIRPSLIGGLRIQVGSDVYDGTVLARLAAIEKSF
jgi:F-type H+-transporting ATPase subunit delta